jgi:glycosyltransferase involved in cell wall biosynthesis
MHVTIVSTYPPRACGLATFARDLRTGLIAAGATADVVSVVHEPAGRARRPEVVYEIGQERREDYAAAAEFINAGSADVVSIQHEFGIFGGSEGLFVLDLMDAVRVPVITRLHTVLPRPEPHYRRALDAIAARSARIVVMTETAKDILTGVYSVDPDIIDVVPHGTPDLDPVRPDGLRERLGLEGRTVLLTFGLLGPSKGIEFAIESLERAVAVQPDVLYVVLGATHPEIVAREGEVYREKVVAEVAARGLSDHVRFENHYVDTEELWDWLRAADVYVSPYPNLDQITSGTLSNALAAGLPVVSTPYLHAAEVLAGGAGRLAAFGDVEAFGDALALFASDPAARAEAGAIARAYGAQTAWPAVGAASVDLAEVAVARPRPSAAPTLEGHPGALLAALGYLDRLTDDCGPFQHAVCGVPDRAHGYCTDDAGRALVVAYDAAARADARSDERRTALRVARTCIGFVAHAQRADGTFRNFMDYGRQWTDRPESEDTVGRAMWGLGATVAWAPDEASRVLARTLLARSLPVDLTHPRAIAYAMCGLDLALDRFPGAVGYTDRLRTHAVRLVEQFERTVSPRWRWFSDDMTYANALVPHALLRAAARLTDSEGAGRFREVGLDALEFVLGQTVQDGRFDAVGNQGWLKRTGERAVFDQQPIEAGYAATAWAEAARLTGEPRYADAARLAVGWFAGRNRIGAPLFDVVTGAAYDGFGAQGVNLNQGAESAIAHLLALLAAERLGPATESGEAADREPAAHRPDSRATRVPDRPPA